MSKKLQIQSTSDPTTFYTWTWTGTGNLQIPTGGSISTDGGEQISLPSQTGQTGNVLTTDGANPNWSRISDLGGLRGATGATGPTGPQGTVAVAGSSGALQYSMGSTLGATGVLTWDRVNLRLGINNGTPSYTLDVTGNIRSTATVYAQDFDNVSDISFKENIAPLSQSLDIVKKLNPVSFTWKNSGEKSLGLIAQEVEMVLPEIVHLDPINKTRTVSYVQLISLLIDAIKEQQKQIDKLNNNGA